MAKLLLLVILVIMTMGNEVVARGGGGWGGRRGRDGKISPNPFARPNPPILIEPTHPIIIWVK